MAVFPGITSVSGPDRLQVGSPAPVADMSGLTQGVRDLVNSGNRIVQEQKKKRDVIDLSAAEAARTKGFLDMGNQFEEDGDYSTFDVRAEKGSHDIINNAAALIRDPSMRERWVAEAETTRLSQ